MKLTAVRDWFGISLAVIALAWLTYSTGYTNGTAAHPQVDVQYERMLLDYEGRRSDKDDLTARLGAGWAVESAVGSPEVGVLYVLRRARP